MFNPDQLDVNEVWIAFKLNGAPLSTQNDGDLDVLALMDAASRFIMGTEFVSACSAEPSEMESRRLLKSGYSQKQQFPKKLIISANLVADTLRIEAERHGITTASVPEKQLLVCIREARSGFDAHVNSRS